MSMRTGTAGSDYYGNISNTTSVPSLWKTKDKNDLTPRTREINNFQVHLNKTAYETRPREPPKSQLGVRHLGCYQYVDFRDEGVDPYNKLANTFYGKN